MKDILRESLRSTTAANALNVARDYLQVSILDKLQHAGAMRDLAFVGGTALRLIYDLPRYSEDLDFTLVRAKYELKACASRIKSGLRREGFDAEARIRDKSVVQSVRVVFPGLPWELGLSPNRTQNLMINVEVDTRPPQGANLEVSLARKHGYILRLQHHDRASLLSGKLHAVLQRPFAKGRDYYDLVWYLSDRSWPSPNLKMLNNALKQTNWTGPRITTTNWRQTVSRHAAAIDWTKLRADVAWLLLRSTDLELLTLDNLKTLLRPTTYIPARSRIQQPDLKAKMQDGELVLARDRERAPTAKAHIKMKDPSTNRKR
jgi:predicted nucleotidyltransferase component of viral defense system